MRLIIRAGGLPHLSGSPPPCKQALSLTEQILFLLHGVLHLEVFHALIELLFAVFYSSVGVSGS